MKIRLLSAVVALILAVVGVVLIVSYVQGADQRAMAGTKTEQVLVVSKPVPAGTPVSALDASLQLRSIPAAAVVDGAMTSLSKSAGTVTAVNLVPGEQLLRSRLVKPNAVNSSGTVPPPKGLQEITVQLGPERTVGARLKAGDTVGVYLSFAENPQETQLVLQKVLVTNVQGAPAKQQSGTNQATAAPTGSLMVTFAVTAAEAQKIVYTAEFGTIWLSLENADAVEGSPGGAVRDNVFQ